MAKISFESADILDVEICSNGLMGGDSGHGGFTVIELKSTNQFEVNGVKMYDLKLLFTGDSERINLRDALRYMAHYLDEELI
jgi:hypothetical protein